jgi:predicted NUDIX family phosphoesterase
MSAHHTEHVLVVPTAEFQRLGYFQGFSSDVDRYLPHLLASNLVCYRPRDAMEQDRSFKQLIPYVIFQHTDSAGQRSLFQYTRGSGQGEARLHRKQSIGVGGHISADDAQLFSGAHPYQEGLRRELAEEVELATVYVERCVGLINDDQSEVGQVHLGVVHLFEVREPAVRPREEALHAAGFESLPDLWAGRDRMERWSRIGLEALFADH